MFKTGFDYKLHRDQRLVAIFLLLTLLLGIETVVGIVLMSKTQTTTAEKPLNCIQIIGVKVAGRICS